MSSITRAWKCTVHTKTFAHRCRPVSSAVKVLFSSSMRTSFCWKNHHIDVIMTTLNNDHLKSPASRLFTQTFIQTQIKENIKAPRHWPLCGEFTGTGEFPAQRASYAVNVSIWWRHHVMAPWCGNALYVAVKLWGKSTGHRWIPLAKGMWYGSLMFSSLLAWTLWRKMTTENSGYWLFQMSTCVFVY